VIWKQKILIIVVTLVCIGVGGVVGVKNSKAVLPVVYQADVVIRIGQQLEIPPAEVGSHYTDYIESPQILAGVIPYKYGFAIEEASGYHLEVKQIKGIPMLKLVVKGPDKEVDKILRQIVEMVIEDHRKKTEVSVGVYKRFVKKLKEEYEILQTNIDLNQATINELRRRGGMHLEDMVATGTGIKEERKGGGESAFLHMLYLKSIDEEREKIRNRADLRNTQWLLMKYSVILDYCEKYYTMKFGEVKSTAVKQRKKSAKSVMIVAVVVGLMMSLFVAFFKEFVLTQNSQ
jgi:hypothetical protein